MFKTRTLFVLGAGASNEVGLPTGSELTKTIATNLAFHFEHGHSLTSGSLEISDALRFKAQDADPFPLFAACRRIRDGMPASTSIDTFLDNHQDDANITLCGKLAIVSSILAAEKSSRLYVDPFTRSREPLSLETIADTWFVKFFRLLHEGCPRTKADALFEQVSFISFNYDRCIEFFLADAMRAAYGMSEDEAQRIVSHARIYHPYGTVGGLPWQQRPGVQFGGGPLGEKALIAAAGRIRTYTEGLEDAETLNGIRAEVRKAHSIVFLGFAYHDQNLSLLDPSNPSDARRIFGTTYGISNNDVAIVEHKIRQSIGRLLTHGNLNTFFGRSTCSKLFDEYRLRLATTS